MSFLQDGVVGCFWDMSCGGWKLIPRVWLTWWESDQFNRPTNFYEGMYALLGVTQAIFTFGMGAVMGVMSYLASNNLHAGALQSVFHAPMSTFDTQPLGRILGVFGKDVDVVDNQLADSLRMMAMTLVSVSCRNPFHATVR